MKFRLLLIALYCCSSVRCQIVDYAVASIPAELLEHANAVVRFDKTETRIESSESVVRKRFRAVTVLNEYGLSGMQAYEGYRVKSICATLYDANGREIKKFKRKDFHEESATSGASLITDGRVTYLNYVPASYPFTIVYQSETEDANSAFINPWYPRNQNYISVERSEYIIDCTPNLGFKYKEYNYDGNGISREDRKDGLTYIVKSLPALKKEAYAPSVSRYLPYTMFGIGKFNLEGVAGDATSWENFGAWAYNTLLVGTDELPEATVAKLKSLVGTESDPLKKARIVYQYMQNKTRYVSIQLGIGGWKPMKAKDVDRLGYGDCKALTNYMRSMLAVVGVPSYYSIIYGDRDREDLREDFVSMQGNHIILAIPQGDSYVWLECTSQETPFGFLGDFTDDRLSLIVKADGGKLARTESYNNNIQKITGNYRLDSAGGINGQLEIRSLGLEFDKRSSLSSKSDDDLRTHYKEFFSLNNLKLDKVVVQADKNNVEFAETLTLSAERYADTKNDRLFFPVNAFNKIVSIPQRYRSRISPFEISHQETYHDEIIIEIPEGYKVEARPDGAKLEDKFGNYASEISQIDTNHVLFKRTLDLKKGYYAKEEYENFRKFLEQVARYENAKIVLQKS
ncbi:MAG: DUF3857 domain-containing protein [Chitinophagaceae bacterium]|nr:MAG: DUF3857 domain-containing protein [Chitinophagaceae bacterium]